MDTSDSFCSSPPSSDSESDEEHLFDTENISTPRKLQWTQEPLYVDSSVTVGESVYKILDFYFKNSLSKRCVDSVLDLLNVLLPQPNNLPRTRHQLYKLLNTLMPEKSDNIKKHRVCETCSNYLGEWSSTEKDICPSCTSNETNGLFVEYNLQSLLTHAFEVRNLHTLIDEHRSAVSDDPSIICDLTGGAEYTRLKHEVITEIYDICLLWSTDGMPVADNSAAQLWAIQVEVVNIPPKNRRNFLFVCGLHYSRDKPNMLSFLQPFVAAVNDMYSTGLIWRHPIDSTIMHSRVIAPIATLDCPARAAVKNIKQYNGNYGCSYCEHPGETCKTRAGFNHVFPTLETNPPLRTHEGMIEQALQAFETNVSDVKGVKGPSLAVLLPHFNIATGFVPDYMHSVLLGVARMLLKCLFGKNNSGKPYHIRKAVKAEVDELLLNIRPPDCITRIPRELKYLAFWKASEVRSFLLYYAAVILKGKIPEPYYQHFLLLIRSVHILLQSAISTDEILLAECMLNIFVSDVRKLYGLEKCSYNVHQLTHLASAVRLWGPLWAWSAFLFEDGNGWLIKIKHGPNKVDIELLNTIKLINFTYILKHVPKKNSQVDRLVITSGKQCNLLVTEAIEALQTLTMYSSTELCTKPIRLYPKIKVGNKILTSLMYRKQIKRDNTCITWNSSRVFGVVQYYAELDGLYYAIVRQLIYSGDNSIVHHQTNVKLVHIIPIHDSCIVHAVPISEIESQVLRVMDYVCLFPNKYEAK